MEPRISEEIRSLSLMLLGTNIEIHPLPLRHWLCWNKNIEDETLRNTSKWYIQELARDDYLIEAVCSLVVGDLASHWMERCLSAVNPS